MCSQCPLSLPPLHLAPVAIVSLPHIVSGLADILDLEETIGEQVYTVSGLACVLLLDSVLTACFTGLVQFPSGGKGMVT